MPNGRPGDHPITDMLIHGEHPFPSDIEAMIRQLHDINPSILDVFEPELSDWEQGKNLEEGRKRLKELLVKHNRSGF